jgi:hypothetical protein
MKAFDDLVGQIATQDTITQLVSAIRRVAHRRAVADCP